MTVPLSESILIAVARLLDDSMVEPKREPTYSDLDFQMARACLNAADPKAQGQTVGKAKRVRAVLSWALDEAPRSKLRGILRNSPTRRPEPLGGVPKPLPSFAKATEGSPRLHPCSKLQGIRRRRITTWQLANASLVA